MKKELTPEEGAAAKLWHTDLQWEVMDKCLQLFGGSGYMNEYPIARAWRAARVTRIFGGTNELMKELIGRKLCRIISLPLRERKNWQIGRASCRERGCQNG